MKPRPEPAVRGSVLTLTADHELDAAEILERLGPQASCRFALVLLRMVAEVTR